MSIVQQMCYALYLMIPHMVCADDFLTLGNCVYGWKQPGYQFTIETTGQFKNHQWSNIKTPFTKNSDVHMLSFSEIQSGIERSGSASFIVLQNPELKHIIHIIDRSLILTNPLSRTSQFNAYEGPFGALFKAIEEKELPYRPPNGFIAIGTGQILPWEIKQHIQLEQSQRTVRQLLTESLQQNIDSSHLWTAEVSQDGVQIFPGNLKYVPKNHREWNIRY